MRVITKTPAPVWRIVELLPEKIRREIYRVSDSIPFFEDKVSEIRLRAGGAVSMTCGKENILLSVSLSKEETEQCVKGFCDGSVYAYSDTIKSGYISLEGGIRAGVAGTALTEGEHIRGVRDISSLNIRIPRDVRGVGAPILEIIRARNYRCGVLIYSSPGTGKTTLLRSLAREISRTKRVSIIDTRGELDISGSGSYLVDLLSAYPKGAGIEIATRTLSPEYIICDEIGAGETKEILAAGAGGVPLIASMHAADYSELLRKDCVREFLRAKIFDVCVGIEREEGERDYTYDLHYPEEDI